ncbi:uncharacterized protein LOC6527440 [Drosophila yakuba]|uniref:Choline/carnitine acyltransferase domain-containing protein n=1 Tax=Drosophila yakuba TaxID=7245 RepID=B4P2L4_DROYA|nr:uncharacterized protein LOC6527440 [Drosophila yakuba]EDW88244.1 uncharacterized protein Dyak_GE18615 [Drosophila yakuba]
MRVLLGTKCFLNLCKHRIRWHHKGSSYLPPQQLYDVARNVIRTHRLALSARFLSGKGKPPETPTLDLICRALASAKNSVDGGKPKNPLKLESMGQISTGSSSQAFTKNTLPIKEESKTLLKSELEPELVYSKAPEVFNCKNCFEYSSEIMIVNCKDCIGDNNQSTESVMGKGTLILQDDSTNEPTSALKEPPTSASKPSVGDSPPSIAAKNTSLLQENSTNQPNSALKEPSTNQPRSALKEPSTKPASKPSVVESQPSVAAKKPPVSPSSTSLNERFTMPQKSAFPLGRNPCTDGKKTTKSKCPPPKPKPCTSSEGEHKPPAKKKPPSKPKPKNPPKTVDSSASGAQKKENDPAKPRIANTPSNKPPSEKSSANPKVGFSMPSNTAFPLGRNPCVDGKNEKKGPKCAASNPKPLQKAEKDDRNRTEISKNAAPIKKAATVPSGSPKPPESVVPKAKPPKKKSMRQGIVNPKEPTVKPKSPPVKTRSPPVKSSASPKPAPKAIVQPKNKELPELSTSRFSMPLMSAFPIGRNPCRDGPRGSAKDESPCGKKVVNICQSGSDSCKAKKNRSNNAKLNVVPQKAVKKSDASKTKASVEPPPPAPPVKEIPVTSDPEKPAPKVRSHTAEKAPMPKGIEAKESPALQPWPATSKTEIRTSTEQKVKSPTPVSSEPKYVGPKRSNCEVKTQCAATKAKKIPKKCEESRVRHLADANNDPSTKPKLKKFPALPLKQSIASYLSSIEPFLSKEELKVQRKVTKEFVDNEGTQLQELLENEAERSDNWLTPRWTRSAYLTYQAPLTVFSSPGLSFPIQKFDGTNDFLNFTAKAIYGMCEFKQLVDQNKIPVVKMGKHYLDNSQFAKIFGTVRKPGRFCDIIEQYNDADYIVVVYNNNYFKLPIYSESGTLLHVHTLKDALADILECPLEVGEHFGLLTHDNRSNWAEAYTVLCRLHGNADTVETIEQSLFVVCLDKCVPTLKGEERVVQAHQLLHGGGVRQNSANRWMDKTIQLIVNPNGLAGFCYEHSPADCQPLAMLMDFVQQKVHEENYGCGGCEADKKVTSTLLKFQPVNECINLWLCQARRNIKRIASQLQVNVMQFECHGKCFIKAQGLNPDSYIQMALSLAYHSMHQKLPAQYESAHLRIFHEGRTETIRSTSNESKAFLMAMQSQTASMSEKLSALQKAVDAHERLIKEAINGQGIDRHLFGLQAMALENGMPLPEFFRSKGYVRSVTFQLFTSQVATSHEGFMAYGPLLSDGYGVCYNPQEKKIIFAISAWKSCPQINVIRFGKAIKHSLNDMRKLILNTGGDSVGEHPCKCEKILL